jgi:hypothetical protein
MSAPSESAPSESTKARWTPVVLALARELWVLRDRVRVLECVLAARGALAADEIDQYQPNETQQLQLDRDCEAFVARLVEEMPGR